MSRTTLSDGSVRFAPDRGHRSKRKIDKSQIAIPLAVAVPVAGLGARGVGLVAGLAIAGVTAVVTLIAVGIWRLTLPRLVSVTATPTHLVYRRYGRTDAVERGPKTRAAIGMVVMQMGLESPYLIASCDGDGFLLNADLWAEQDLRDIAAMLPTEPASATGLTVAQVRDEFPGAMPFHMSHPIWTAIIVLAIVVPVATAAMWTLTSPADGEDPIDRGRQTPLAAQPAAGLPPTAAADQNQLLAQAQGVFDEGTSWETPLPETVDCEDTGGWQRILDARSDDGSSGVAPDTDVRQELRDLAEAAGLTAVADRSGAAGSYELNFQDAESGAFLRVRGNDGDGWDISISTGSACTISTGR